MEGEKVKKKYTIGLDYGTLSGRGILTACENGAVLASAVREYDHGVMDTTLCAGREALPGGWTLQHPADYIAVLDSVVPELLRQSGVDPREIIGIGIDFTACTMLPVDDDAVPLCEKEAFRGRRNAYVKLWKHHGAQKHADRINRYLEEKGLADAPRFGGKVSPELLLPKVLEMLEEDPELYEAADAILEAGDWLTRVLTGSHARSCSMAGYKAWWNDREGYPDAEFFTDLDPRLASFTGKKLAGRVTGVGETAGTLSAEGAARLGLCAGTVVAPTIIDSHAGVPGSGVGTKEQAMLVLGTSSVMVGLSETPCSGSGIMGGVKDAIVPGYYALESGLASVGDLFGWFVDHCVPPCLVREAEEKNIHTLLSEKAARIAPGSSGLLALDWWNGNKTPFVDGGLKGALIGLSLNTKPEEIYRALIESTAYGTRRILALYEENGLSVREIICSGGIALKNPLLMQIYADVLGKPLKVAGSEQTAALGSAIYAALSAGAGKGGYDCYAEAVRNMSKVRDIVYEPDGASHARYTELYAVYQAFGEIMGSSSRGIMRRLSELQTE